MSGSVQATIYCDACEEEGEDTEAFGVGDGFTTLKAVREYAHRTGWETITLRGNKRRDLCPSHRREAP